LGHLLRTLSVESYRENRSLSSILPGRSLVNIGGKALDKGIPKKKGARAARRPMHNARHALLPEIVRGITAAVSCPIPLAEQCRRDVL
jgi:hypothetical protein